jgi:hypothetical protein
MRKNAKIFKKYKNTQNFFGYLGMALGIGMMIFGYLGIYQPYLPKQTQT